MTRRMSDPIPATLGGGILGKDRGEVSSAGHNGTHLCWWSGDDDDDDDVCDGDDRPWSCHDAVASAPVQSSESSKEDTPDAVIGAQNRKHVESCAVVSLVSTAPRLRRKRTSWTAHHDHQHLVSALATLQACKCGGVELVGWVLPSLKDTIVLGILPTASSLSSNLLELHLVQCAVPDLSVLKDLRHLETLRITDCNVRDVTAREWKTCLSTLTYLTTLRLEALELDNAALHSIASNVGHVITRISIGPLYNPRQFFPSLRTIVQESRCQTLELFGGGSKDSNLIHVVNGMGRLQGRQQHGISTGDASGNAVQTLVVENFACSKALFAKLCRRLHHHSSLENGGLRHFSFALAQDGPSASSSPHPPTVDLLPVVALLQSNTRLQSLCLDPPMKVDTQWHAPLLRAVQRNTHLEKLSGFVLREPDDERRGAKEARWREQIDFCLKLNRCGRRALDLPSVHSNWALWPHVLHHALHRSNDPNVVLYFLKSCLHRQ
jgi:hypothetical protein